MQGSFLSLAGLASKAKNSWSLSHPPWQPSQDLLVMRKRGEALRLCGSGQGPQWGPPSQTPACCFSQGSRHFQSEAQGHSTPATTSNQEHRTWRRWWPRRVGEHLFSPSPCFAHSLNCVVVLPLTPPQNPGRCRGSGRPSFPRGVKKVWRQIVPVDKKGPFPGQNSVISRKKQMILLVASRQQLGQFVWEQTCNLGGENLCSQRSIHFVKGVYIELYSLFLFD